MEGYREYWESGCVARYVQTYYRPRSVESWNGFRVKPGMTNVQMSLLPCSVLIHRKIKLLSMLFQAIMV